MSSSRKIAVNIERYSSILTQAATGGGTVAKEQLPGLARERGDKKLIVVAAAPKTGSTFLSNTLSKFTHFPYFRLSSGYATNEHDLYLPALCLMNGVGCVSQMHMKGTFHNAHLLRVFGITPIILVRNIEDVVLSLSRDLKKKETLPGYHMGQNGYSFLWLDTCTEAASEAQLLDMIIDLAIPWYVNYYVSWYRLCQQNVVTAKWVTYEEMMTNKKQTVEEILSFLGYQDLRGLDDSLLSQRYTTYTEQPAGQASIGLSDAQRDRLRRPFSYYPDVDFGMYGLSSPL